MQNRQESSMCRKFKVLSVHLSSSWIRGLNVRSQAFSLILSTCVSLTLGKSTCWPSAQFLLPAVGPGGLGPSSGGRHCVPAVPPGQHTNLTRRNAGEGFLANAILTAFVALWNYFFPDLSVAVKLPTASFYFSFYRVSLNPAAAVLLPQSYSNDSSEYVFCYLLLRHTNFYLT